MRLTLLQAIKDAGSTDPQEVNKAQDQRLQRGNQPFSFDEKQLSEDSGNAPLRKKGEVTEAVNVSASIDSRPSYSSVVLLGHPVIAQYDLFMRKYGAQP